MIARSRLPGGSDREIERTIFRTSAQGSVRGGRASRRSTEIPEVIPRERSERVSRALNFTIAAVALVVASPLLITDSDASPPWFRPITRKLVEALPAATAHTYEGSGHAPHLTHPEDYLSVVGEFLSRRATREFETAIAAS